MSNTAAPTNNPTTVPTGNVTDSPTGDCVDETACISFALAYCVNKNAAAGICFPPVNAGTRRFLKTQIQFHQEALAELSMN